MTPTNKPYVICHMMQTIDGKIASGVEGVEVIMDYFDLYTSTEQKLASKTWMFGRKTGQAFAADMGTPLSLKPEGNYELDFVAPHEGDRYVVISDVRGVLRWKQNFLNLSEQEHDFHLILIVNHETPKEYLAYLQSLEISYVIAGETTTSLPIALEKLQALFGIEKLLLEGGGSFNGSMMADGLVDEISLLLLPRVLNKKDAPSLFDATLNEIKTIDYLLDSCSTLEKGVLWLRYIRR